MAQRPIEQSYWVIPHRLLASEYPGASTEARAREKLRKFLDAGVGVFVDLTQPDEGLIPYTFLLAEEAESLGKTVTYRRMPITDAQVPTAVEMRSILDTIDQALDEGHTVCVHCWGGIGRTGTVVGSHLVRRGATGEEALRRVQELFHTTPETRESPETPEQEQFVQAWAAAERIAEDDAAEMRDRYRGALLGLAVGDALGTTIEFTAPGPHGLTDMVGGGPFELAPGQWTDDTSMALCLAESLVECGCFAPTDQLDRYVRWWREGHRSSTGTCFDIGSTTRDALSRFQRTGEPYCGSEHPQSAGNGSIMRLAPVPLFFAGSPKDVIERSGESSRTTHGAREAVDACRYLGGLIAGAVGGASKEQLLSSGYAPAAGYWDDRPLSPKIAAIAAGSFKHKAPPDIRGRGYVVPSLEAALWAFYRSHSFRDGALLAVNLGEDADTTGAVYGQIAGALYGEDGIPATWRERLHECELIANLADQLFASAQR